MCVCDRDTIKATERQMARPLCTRGMFTCGEAVGAPACKHSDVCDNIQCNILLGGAIVTGACGCVLRNL